MRLRSFHVGLLVVVSIFGVIAVTSATGLWKTRGSRTPARYSRGEFVGLANPADIRGSYTFADVERAFGVPVEVLAEAFGVPTEFADRFRASELESRYGEADDLEVGTDTLRLFVALDTGRPYESEESTGLLSRTFEVLNTRYADRGWDVAPLEEYRTRVVPDEKYPDPTSWESYAGGISPQEHEGEPEDPGTSPLSDHQPAAEAGAISGQTTFADLLSWGLSREEIEEALGVEMPPRATRIRDFAASQGVGFGVYRARLEGVLAGE